MTERLHLLQFGSTGQLARELVRAASTDGSIQATVLSRAEADFAKPAEVAAAIHAAPFLDVVVNAVAYTAVDRAEADRSAAETVNAVAVGALAQACRDRDVPLIHVSTDYVYDGLKQTPYQESDAVNPLSIYGQTKLAGEALIRENWGKHVIIRTSWVYSAHGTNFVKTMLRLGAERDELRVVDDQTGAPTSASDLSRAILVIAKQLQTTPNHDQFGIFHFANAGETTWRRFAEEIFSQARWAATRARVIPIAAADYPLPARRPMNSRLDTRKIQSVFGVEPAAWRNALPEVLAELKESRT